MDINSLTPIKKEDNINCDQEITTEDTKNCLVNQLMFNNGGDALSLNNETLMEIQECVENLKNEESIVDNNSLCDETLNDTQNDENELFKMQGEINVSEGEMCNINLIDVSKNTAESLSNGPVGECIKKEPFLGNSSKYTNSESESKEEENIIDGSKNNENGTVDILRGDTFSKPQSEASTIDSDEDSSSDSSSLTFGSDSDGEKKITKPESSVPRKKKDVHKIKGELDIEDLPPIEELHISVTEDDCEALGKVYSIVNQLVVVESLPNTPALDLDSVLFRAKGKVLGVIFDVFGPVKSPYYSVRFNSKQDILDKGITKGEVIYCAPQTEYTQYVFTYQLMKQKGSDASWMHNHEPPDSMLDYSDDEKEKLAKQNRNKKSSEIVKVEDSDGPKRKHLKTYDNWNNNFKAAQNWQKRSVEASQSGYYSVRVPRPPLFVPPLPVRPPTPGPFSAPPPARMTPPFETRPRTSAPFTMTSPSLFNTVTSPPPFNTVISPPPFTAATSTSFTAVTSPPRFTATTSTSFTAVTSPPPFTAVTSPPPPFGRMPPPPIITSPPPFCTSNSQISQPFPHRVQGPAQPYQVGRTFPSPEAPVLPSPFGPAATARPYNTVSHELPCRSWFPAASNVQASSDSRKPAEPIGCQAPLVRQFSPLQSRPPPRSHFTPARPPPFSQRVPHHSPRFGQPPCFPPPPSTPPPFF